MEYIIIKTDYSNGFPYVTSSLPYRSEEEAEKAKNSMEEEEPYDEYEDSKGNGIFLEVIELSEMIDFIKSSIEEDEKKNIEWNNMLLPFKDDELNVKCIKKENDTYYAVCYLYHNGYDKDQEGETVFISLEELMNEEYDGIDILSFIYSDIKGM